MGFNDENHFVRQAQRDGQRDPNGFFADQFNNPHNKQGHFTDTAVEIYEQMKGKLDIFVMGAGTGATINGISHFLKEKKNMKVTVVLSDPTGSSLYNWARFGTFFTSEDQEGHKKRKIHRTVVEGIGLNWLCKNTEGSLIDDSEKVTDKEAYYMARYILTHEGLLIGSTTAVNLVASIKHCMRNNLSKKRVVTISCDDGFRHIGRFYDLNQWEKEGFAKPPHREFGDHKDLSWIEL